MKNRRGERENERESSLMVRGRAVLMTHQIVTMKEYDFGCKCIKYNNKKHNFSVCFAQTRSERFRFTRVLMM